MAGNPCEELSPTGGKKKKKEKKKKKNRTRSYCTVLRQFKDQVQPAHKSQVLLVRLVIYLEHSESSSHTYHSPELGNTCDNLPSPCHGRRV